jgi:hypothetical protein
MDEADRDRNRDLIGDRGLFVPKKKYVSCLIVMRLHPYSPNR